MATTTMSTRFLEYWSRLPLLVQAALVFVFIVVVPFVLDVLEGLTNFGLLTRVNSALIYVVLALGLNIVVGFAGLLDMGYAAFFAIGAYAFGVLTWPTHDIEMSFFLAIWVCAGVAAAFGTIIGAPTLRLRGDYLAIVTLAFGEIIPTVVRNFGDFTFTLHSLYLVRLAGWLFILLAVPFIFRRVLRRINGATDSPDQPWYKIPRFWGLIVIMVLLFWGWETLLYDLSVDGKFDQLDQDVCAALTDKEPERTCKLVEDVNLTNGSQGLVPLGKPDFSAFEGLLNAEPGSLRVSVSPHFWYYAIVIVTGIVLFASRRLEDSRLGRAWKAIREDETAADFMGVDPIRTKLLAFAIGASFSGLAGAVYASMLGAIFPESFRFQVSIFLLIIVVLSGRGSVWGVLMGGLLISFFDGVFLAQILPDVFPNTDVQSLRWVFFGLGLIVIMIFRPQGLFPVASSKKVVIPATVPPAPIIASQEQ